MSLFNTPRSAFYRPPPGQYIGEFVRIEEGPASTRYPLKDGTPAPRVRWVWKLYNLDDTPFMDDGKQAEGDGLTSAATGPDSNAYKYFKAHGHTLAMGEDMDDALEEIEGSRVSLLYIPDDNDVTVGRLSVVMAHNG